MKEDGSGMYVWSKEASFALKLNKFIVWPMGLWPLEPDGWFAYSRNVFAFTSQLWLIFTQMKAVQLRCGNASDIVDMVMLSVCGIMALSKIVAFRVHMPKLRTVFASALEDWLLVRGDEARDAAMPFARRGRKVILFQMIACYASNTLIFVGALPFLMPPMDNSTNWNETSGLPSRQLPLKTGCLFAHYRDEIYGFLYVYEEIVIQLTTHGNVGCDLVLFSLAMHLCGQIEVLKRDISRFGAIREDLAESQSRVRQCVARHCRLLEMAKLMNQTVSGMLVVQLTMNAGMNLMLGLRVIMAVQSGQLFDAVRPLIAFVVLMLQLFLFSYASDQLSQQAESILDALYDSSWYEFPAQLRKELCFVAMRATKPIYLTAGHFYTMNIENFKNTLKASFSYFSILRVMFDG